MNTRKTRFSTVLCEYPILVVYLVGRQLLIPIGYHIAFKPRSLQPDCERRYGFIGPRETTLKRACHAPER